LQNAPRTLIAFRNVPITEAITFIAGAYGVNVRFEGVAAQSPVPAIQFIQASVEDAFRTLVAGAGLRYTVVNETTIIVSPK
jgi:hypothetical protein